MMTDINKLVADANSLINNNDSSYDTIESVCKRLLEYSISATYHESKRWTTPVTSICKVGTRYFKVDWDEGLTEYQDNQYLYNPTEVYEATANVIIPEHTVTRTEYLTKDKYDDFKKTGVLE